MVKHDKKKLHTPLYMSHDKINLELDLLTPLANFVDSLTKEVPHKAQTSVTLKKVDKTVVKEEMSLISEKEEEKGRSSIRRKSTKMLPDLSKLDMFKKHSDK